MKKKVLTLLGALAALGLAACDPAAPASSAPASNPASSQPAASSKPAESSKPASSKPASSTPASSSQPAVETDPFKKATGHSVKNYQDVPGDAEKGTAAYKMGLCEDNDGFSAIRVNQSAVTYPSGSKRKNGTPEGYTKLDGNGQKMTFKIEVAKGYTGKLYLFGVMDNWSSNTGSSFFYNGAPNTKIEVNGVSIDCSAQNGKTYLDYFGDGQGEGTLSPEGYAEFGSCTLKPGVNEIVYTRVETLNMLVKDFVFVGEEAQEWSAPVEVAADATAGTVAYKKYTNNFDGSVKIEFNAMDGSLVGSSALKTDGPAGYMKLDKKGEKQISYKFNFDANLDGKFYQHGMMDSYTDRDGNKDRTYYSGSDNDSVPNFKFHVNDVNVYVGEMRNVKYKEFFGETEVDIGGKKYSELNDCEIGDCFLKNGENNITFERVNSYNLLVDKFVFIGKAGNAHTAPEATAEWHMDEISHWQEAANDSFKWNRADNVWEADPDHADEPATCVAPGKTYVKEHTTGVAKAIDTEIDPYAHEMTVGDTVQNSDGKDVINMECSRCHKKGAKISVNDYVAGAAFDKDDDKAANNIRPTQNSAISYKIVAPVAGRYAIYLGCVCKSNEGVKMGQRGFSVTVDGAAATVDLDANKTPANLGMGPTVTSPVDVRLVSDVELTAGEHTIAIKVASHRLYYSGYVTIAQFADATPAAAE